MGIFIKSEKEIQGIRAAGIVVAKTFDYIKPKIKPGLTLRAIEELCTDFIKKEDAKPAFKNYKGFPANICVSVNEEVVHGIPNGRRLKPSDVVKIDIGVYKDGFYADGAKTFPIGEINSEVQKLLETTEKSLELGIAQALENNRISDISWAIQKFVEDAGFSVVRELSGHGVGIELHEEPKIPNFGEPGKGTRLVPGMTLAIEPMVNLGTYEVMTLGNGWTVVTKDGKYSAHFEHTILVTNGKPEILTFYG